MKEREHGRTRRKRKEHRSKIVDLRSKSECYKGRERQEYQKGKKKTERERRDRWINRKINVDNLTRLNLARDDKDRKKIQTELAGEEKNDGRAEKDR